MVFTLDNHYLTGGQGQMILAALAELDLPRPVRARALGLSQVPHSGQNEEVLRAHGLDAAALFDVFRRELCTVPT
jgi:transketolase